MDVEISIGQENFEQALQTDDGLFFIYYTPSDKHYIAVVPKFSHAAPLFLENAIEKAKPSEIEKTSNNELIQKSNIFRYESRRIRRVLTLNNHDNKTITYYGPLLIDDIVNWMMRQIDPTNELPIFKIQNYQEISIVDFVNNIFFKITSTDENDKLKSLPNEKDLFKKYQVEDNETIMLFKKFNKGQSIFEGEFDINKLDEHIKKHSMLVIDYHRKYSNDIFKCGYKNYLYISLNRNRNVDFKELTDHIKECAELLKNKILFVLSDIYNEDDMKFIASVLTMKKKDEKHQGFDNKIIEIDEFNYCDKIVDKNQEGNYDFDRINNNVFFCYPDQYLLRPVIKELAGKFKDSNEVGVLRIGFQSNYIDDKISKAPHVLLYNKVTNEVFGYIEEKRIHALINFLDDKKLTTLNCRELTWNNIQINNRNEFLDPEELFQRYGGELTHLNYNDELKMLLIIGKYCKNLEEFIVEIDIFPIDELIAAVSSMKNLESIEIRRISQNKNKSSIDFFVNLPVSIKKIEIKSDLFPKIEHLQAGNNFIISRFNCLHTLTMEFFEFHENTMEEIGKLKTLVNLSLNYCVIKKGIDFISNLKNLNNLSLVHVDTVDDDFLVNLINNCKYINKLNISFCKSINCYGFSELMRLKNLKHLELMGTSLRDNELGEFKNLHCLFCHGCKNVSDIGVLKVVQNSPDLRHLGLIDTNITFNTVEFLDSFTKYRTNNIILFLKVDEIVTFGIFDNKRIKITSPFLKISTRFKQN